MSDTPRTDALVALWAKNVPVPTSFIEHARELERRYRLSEQGRGEALAAKQRAFEARDDAIQRARNLRLEAKGYHNALMRCETDGKRWQYWRKRGIDLSGESDLGVVYRHDADRYTDQCLDGRVKPEILPNQFHVSEKP